MILVLIAVSRLTGGCAFTSTSPSSFLGQLNKNIWKNDNAFSLSRQRPKTSCSTTGRSFEKENGQSIIGALSSRRPTSCGCSALMAVSFRHSNGRFGTRLWARQVEQEDDEETATLGPDKSIDQHVPGYSISGSEVEFDISTAVALVAGQSLVVLGAVIIAYFVKTPLLGLGDGFALGQAEAWQWGLVATIPLGILAFVLDGFEESFPALQRVTKATQRSVLTLMGGKFLPITGFATATALGIAAGVGEEWLFRGVLQTELIQRIFTDANVAPAVLLSSLVFGALHAVTPLYAILATLASLYFGFLYIWTDNLAVPMICHALYDIGALYYAHWSVAKDLTPQQRKDLLNMPL